MTLQEQERSLLQPSAPFRLIRKQDRRTETWEYAHAHDGMEFLLIHEGYGEVRIGQDRYPLDGSALVIIRPFQRHGIRIRAGTRYHRTGFIAEPKFIEHTMHAFPHHSRLFWHLLDESAGPQVVSLSAHTEKSAHTENAGNTANAANAAGVAGVADAGLAELESLLRLLFNDMYRRTESGEPAQWTEEYSVFLLQLLFTLDAHGLIGQAARQPGASSGRLRKQYAERTMAWIERHFREPIQLDDAAAALHLSPYHLSRLFNDEAGCTFRQWVTSRRIREACFLLATTSLPLKHICRKSGFSGTSYFCQVFRKHLGTTPYQFRSAGERKEAELHAWQKSETR